MSSSMWLPMWLPTWLLCRRQRGCPCGCQCGWQRGFVRITSGDIQALSVNSQRKEQEWKILYRKPLRLSLTNTFVVVVIVVIVIVNIVAAHHSSLLHSSLAFTLTSLWRPHSLQILTFTVFQYVILVLVSRVCLTVHFSFYHEVTWILIA